MAVRKVPGFAGGPEKYVDDGDNEVTQEAYLQDQIQSGIKNQLEQQAKNRPGLDAADLKKRQEATFGPSQGPAPRVSFQKTQLGPMAQLDPALLAQRQKFSQGRRDELSRQFNAQAQTAQDAMGRRFASMGMSNSGAALKAGLEAQNDIEAQRRDAENRLGQDELGQQLQLEQADLARRDAYDAKKLAVDQANADAEMKAQLANIEIANKYQDKDMAQKQFILDQDTTEFNKRMAEIESRRPSGGGGGGCCYIFLEARYGSGLMDSVVRRYRDEHMTPRNRRGYYKLSEVLVPLMRRSRMAKLAVRALMTDPLVSYGKYYYGEGKIGWIFKPVVNFWMKAFNYLGQDHEYIRENGEVI